MLKRASKSKGGIYLVSFKIKAIKRTERADIDGLCALLHSLGKPREKPSPCRQALCTRIDMRGSYARGYNAS